MTGIELLTKRRMLCLAALANGKTISRDLGSYHGKVEIFQVFLAWPHLVLGKVQLGDVREAFIDKERETLFTILDDGVPCVSPPDAWVREL